MKHSVHIVFLGLVLSGCANQFAPQAMSIDPRDRHPIVVDQQTVSVRIPVQPTNQGLSRDVLIQLDSLVATYRMRGHGPVTVTAPSGTSTDLDAQQTAADVRQALNARGLDYAAIQGATYRTGDNRASVIVSFSQYVASGPVCGNFQGDVIAALQNRPSPNFGCAQQANLAAMVADPRDLTAMTPVDRTDATAVAAAARAAKTGTNTWEPDGSFKTSVAATTTDGE